MTKTIINIVLNIIEILTVIISGYGVYKIYNLIKLSNTEQLITSWTTILTLCFAIYSFIIHLKNEKLKYSMQLVNDFDSTELRAARNLTRLLKEPHENGEIAPQDLISFIDNKDSNKKIKKLRKKFYITEEERLNLRVSVIFMFNYWEKVISGIKYNAVNDRYIIEHLSEVYASQFDRFKPWIEHSFSKGGYQYLALSEFNKISCDYIKNKKKIFYVVGEEICMNHTLI